MKPHTKGGVLNPIPIPLVSFYLLARAIQFHLSIPFV